MLFQCARWAPALKSACTHSQKVFVLNQNIEAAMRELALQTRYED